MYKTKPYSLFAILSVAVIIFSLTAIAVVQAVQNQNQEQNQERIESQNNSSPTVETIDEDEADENDEDEADEADEVDEDEDDATSSHGQINAQAHRSVVANFVLILLQVADREGGIGQQVRVIAQQQNDSEATTSQAIEKIQKRSKIIIFLVGSDYKNLGALRSETVQTRNRIEQLNRVMTNIQNEGDKTELQNQIQTLTQEQTNIQTFVKDQEGKFSLFGWLIKLIYGYKNSED